MFGQASTLAEALCGSCGFFLCSHRTARYLELAVVACLVAAAAALAARCLLVLLTLALALHAWASCAGLGQQGVMCAGFGVPLGTSYGGGRSCNAAVPRLLDAAARGVWGRC